MSMRRAHIPPSPPRKPPNEWQLAVFTLGLTKFTHATQDLAGEHMKKHANRSSTWRTQNGVVTDLEPLDVGSVWELPGIGIRIVRGFQEHSWGETVVRSLTRPLMQIEGWEPNSAVLMAAWGVSSLEANVELVTPQAWLLTRNPNAGTGFLVHGMDLKESFQMALSQGMRDIGEVARHALCEGALPKLAELPGWKEAKHAALERQLPRVKTPGPKMRF